MERSKLEARKNALFGSSEDPLKKREAFAVSLRKIKKEEIIRQKRMKLA